MPIGPGKYDDLCSYARDVAEAGATILIILGGKHGSGFSIQAPPEFVLVLPKLLRKMADEIEDDFVTAKGEG